MLPVSAGSSNVRVEVVLRQSSFSISSSMNLVNSCGWKTAFCFQFIQGRYKKKYQKKYHCPPQLYWYSLKRMVVWSVFGPVLLLGVLPILCVQSKSSTSILVNPHKSAVSKEQSSGPEWITRKEQKLIDSVQYYRKGYALTVPKDPWNFAFPFKRPGNLKFVLQPSLNNWI